MLNEMELAKYLGLSKRSIQNLRADGKIPFYRISNRCIRFDPDEVGRALRRFRVSAIGEGD